MILILVSSIAVSGCSMFMADQAGKKAVSSSLVDFLYPNEASREDHKPEIPLLRLPVKVGVAFIPSNKWGDNDISPAVQLELLNKVKASFSQHEFIKHIEVIPSNYLKGGQGFDTLDQLSRLYDIDVIALLSYDQVTQSLENNAAFLYLTIVGLYVIPGNDNSVQTFVDTAVFDIKSRKMLFRAPGLSKSEQTTSAVSINDTLNTQSVDGFNLAVDNMIVNLDEELSRFKVRVKEEKIAKIEHSEGYRGGGSMSWTMLLVMVVAIGRRFKQA